MKIFFLDRNAISCIKSCLNGEDTYPDRIAKLSSIDEKGNLISCKLSVIEGPVREKASKEQILMTLKEEASAISKFYQYAKTDYDFLDKTADKFAETFSGEIEEDWNKYIEIIKEAHKLLYQPIAKKDRKKASNHIVSLAKEKEIKLAHPVIVCCFAILYENNHARNIIKPKKNTTNEELEKSAYNAASDLLVLSRIQEFIEAFKKICGISPVIKFITFDNGLSCFLNSIEVINSHAIPTGGVIVESKYSRDLFPALNDEEYDEFMILLSK